MKHFIFICFCFALPAIGETLRIESIDWGRSSSELDHLYLSDGRIARIPVGKTVAEPGLFLKGSYVNLKLDPNHVVTEIAPASSSTATTEKIPQTGDAPYEPTILPDLATVDTIFQRMNRQWQQESQCYNRAHVWNYEEHNRTGLLSKKVFIFYTRRYIRDYNFFWWFHAIPTVLANHEGTVIERFLDPTFASMPLTMKSWTDLFVRSRRACPVITRYSDYRNNQETEHCYLHFSSMYYWQPRDLEEYERSGFEKTSFLGPEVQHAYWEAF